MKLLSKNQIQEHKSKERQVEIEQALRLAKRVDTLRDTALEEEASLERFRSETLKSLKEDIDSKVKEKDALTRQIEALEERRKELLKPLDEEWDKVRSKEVELESVESNLKDMASRFDSRESYISVKEREMKCLAVQSKHKLDQANLKYSESMDARKEADSILSNARETSDRMKEESSRISAELSRREESIRNREADIQVKEKNQDERTTYLNKRETYINDKYATLERTIKRLSK